MSDKERAAYLELIRKGRLPGWKLTTKSKNGRRLFMPEIQCKESNFVVSLNNKATTIQIVTDNGDTLFSVDSTNTKMNDIENLITHITELFFPEEGYELNRNNSDYSVIKHPMDNGIELSIIVKMGGRIFKKQIKGYNERLTQQEVKCAHLSGLKVVVDPDLEEDKRDRYNMTALIWAILLGQTDVAQDLVERGANVNLIGSHGFNPLIAATFSGKAGMVEYLIKQGANVNSAIGRNKISPLHMAVFKGRLDCIKVLLKHGANIECSDENDNATPLAYAVVKGRINIVTELAGKGANVNTKTKIGDTPLHIAAGLGYVEMVHFLIQSGADLNSKNIHGFTPLMTAITDNYNEDKLLQIVKHMVDHQKIELNAKSIEGDTAMSLATSKGDIKVQAFLQAYGAQ